MKYQLQQYTVLEKNSQYSRYLAKSLTQLLIVRLPARYRMRYLAGNRL